MTNGTSGGTNLDAAADGGGTPGWAGTAGAGTAWTGGRPVGREAELERIRRCLERGPGEPPALVLLGEEGVGRTRLLAAARELAHRGGVRVLSARGWAAERRRPYACLRGLLAPVLEVLRALPAPHGRVLSTAVGLEPGPESAVGPLAGAPAGPLPDPLPAPPAGPAVQTAVQALLTHLGAAGPVLVTVDDVQDCDRPSLEVLCALVRQSADGPASFLFALRGDTAPAGLPAEAEVLRIAPLSARSAAALLDAQPGAPTGRTRLDVLGQAQGNPSALLELGRLAQDDPRLPFVPAARRARAGEAFLPRLRALPPDTRRALGHAAAALPGERATTVMAASGCGDLAVWAPAEEAGLIAFLDGRIVFRHPLARAAARTDGPAHQRYRAHLDLAAVADGDPAHRALHRAAAALTPDESVARALEDGAARSPDAFTAALALEQAARLSTCNRGRARRLAEALAAAQAVGSSDWVRDLYGEFVAVNRDAGLGTTAARAVGAALSLAADQREAFDLLADTADRALAADGPSALGLVAVAAGIAEQSGLPEHRAQLPALLARARATAAARAGAPTAAQGTPEATTAPQPTAASGGGGAAPTGPAWSLADPDAPEAVTVPVLAPPADPATPVSSAPPNGPGPGTAWTSGALAEPGVQAALDGRAELAVAVPGDAARLLRRLERPRLGALPDGPALLTRRIAVATVAYHADEPDACLEQFRRADAQLRARGAFGVRAWFLAPLLDTLLGTGRWAEAEALLTETADTAAVLRLPRVEADLEALALTLAAVRGGTRPDPAVASRAPFAARPVWHRLGLEENGATGARLARAHALAAAARGDWAEAFRHLRSLYAEDGSSRHPFLSPRGIAELALAGCRTGRREEAADVLERVRAEQGDRPTARMTLLLHHATALVGPEAGAEQHFRLAVVNPAGERWPLERGRARLDYAIWLRRSRRPSEARQQLAAALDLAERHGAGPLTTAARNELRASGVATAPGSVDVLAELTAQQQQIVRMAATGLSNREIGERLFLSPRTVGTHLYNVYPKLGISRRHQLRDLLQSG
ncbi:AAA family ATPase [Kitasatospora sp. NPDC127111]|uniref:helix-turn-helix transcriptional regulator n=1 Tax=Kitasatospora sp. NPDC127111 TaxID=3345363 RepID=UPI003645CDF5